MAELNSAATRRDGAGLGNTWVSLKVDEERPEVIHRHCQTCLCVPKYSSEFCKRTSLHGLQYTTEEGRPIQERACWLVVIAVSLVGCMFVIMKQWDKWQTTPVILTFSETSTPVWNIPFPAVTICSELKFKQSVLNFTELYDKYEQGNITDNEAVKLDYTSLLCSNETGYNGSKIVPEDAIQHLFDISPTLDNIFHACFWRGQERDCSQMFSQVLTDDGVCFMFNSLAANELFTDDAVQSSLMDSRHPSSHWSVDGGYSSRVDQPDTYPRRTMSSGREHGVDVILQPWDTEGDVNCIFPVKGFKMVIHNPMIFPEVDNQFFRIPSKRDVMISVHPEIITTSEELLSYNHNLRQCYFESERKLRYFKIYNQQHCEAECYSNYTLKHCGCVAFYMPRSRNTPICGPMMISCSYDVLDDYNFDVDNKDRCDCLPSCSETDYSVQVTHASYIWDKLGNEYANARLTILHIFLKDMQVITKRRSELYGVSDFLSNVGGLLGLFLGFSVLSLVEIIYFMSVRPFFNSQRTTGNKV